MRVALLCPKPQRRGAELFSRQLADELRLRGHEVAEVYFYPPPPGDGLPRGGSEIHLGGSERHWLERLSGWHPAMPSRLGRALAGFRPDIVQASGGKTVKYAAFVAARLPGRPLLVYRNIGEPGVWVHGWRRRLLYSRFVFPRIDAVATVGREFVPKVRVICPNAFVVRWIPRGVDVRRLAPTAGRDEARAAANTASGDRVVLFVGNLSPEKRIDRLLRVFSAVAAGPDSTVLWIAGGGPIEGELRELAARLGCADRCRFLGVRSDVGTLIAASDVVALSSDTEGVPTVLREAAALGRPVVATRAGATAEIVADGETGLLVDRDDEFGFARALEELLGDPERRERMGRAARRRFDGESLSMAAVAGQYEALYREALAARAAEGAS